MLQGTLINFFLRKTKKDKTYTVSSVLSDALKNHSVNVSHSFLALFGLVL